MAQGQGKIGDAYVEFSQKGLPELVKGLQGLSELVKKFGEDAAGAGTRSQGGLSRIADTFRGISAATQALGQSLTAATLPLYGMVTAGVAASGAGQVLSLQFQELNRQLASAFVPTIRYVSERLAALIQWFRSLSGEQQRLIREAGLMAGALAATAVILPRVIASVKLLGAAMKALSMSTPLGLLAVGLGAAALSTVSMEEGMKGAADATRDLAAAMKDVGKAVREAGQLMKDLAGARPDWMKSSVEKKGGGLWEQVKENNPWAASSDLMAAIGGRRLAEAGHPETAKWFNRLGWPLGTTGIGMGAMVAKHFGWIGGDYQPPGAPGKEPRTELPPLTGPPESITAYWMRLAGTSRSIGLLSTRKSFTEKLYDKSVELLETVKDILDDNRARAPEFPRAPFGK